MKRGEVIVDCAGRTGIAGLYAAGDVYRCPGKADNCSSGRTVPNQHWEHILIWSGILL